MKCVEIITLRSLSNIDTEFLKELLREEYKSDTERHPAEVRIYHHSVVETDLSIHIYWESEPGSQNKSSLGLKFSYALRNLGLLNHSVWVEKTALEQVSFGSENGSQGHHSTEELKVRRFRQD